MKLFLFSLAVFLLASLGMALGLLFGRPPIRGSCGGLPCNLCDSECTRGCERAGQDHPRERMP